MNTPGPGKSFREQLESTQDVSEDEVTGEHEVEERTELHIPTFAGGDDEEHTVKTQVPADVKKGS